MPEKTTSSLTLPSDREIEMTRVFNAQRELVWTAYTDPQHVPNWWGTGNPTTTIVDEMDVRPGGRWRWVVRGEDSAEYGFRGEYVEVVPPEKLVYTFAFEPPSGQMTYDLTFEESDGKTRLTAHPLCQQGGAGRHTRVRHGVRSEHGLGPVGGAAGDTSGVTHLAFSLPGGVG